MSKYDRTWYSSSEGKRGGGVWTGDIVGNKPLSKRVRTDVDVNDRNYASHPHTHISSSNPTAAGGAPVTTGKERANHKYKGKVRTKSGKIRYLYDKDGVTTASGPHGSIQKAYQSQKHAKHVSNKAAYMNAWKRREPSENAQRARNADPIRNIQRTGRKIAREGGKAIDNARKGAETQITKMKRYLGKLFG